MDKNQMVQNAILMLGGVNPETLETINFERTEYDDGSVGFSVNLTTPPTKKNKPDSREADEILKAIGKSVKSGTYPNTY